MMVRTSEAPMADYYTVYWNIPVEPGARSNLSLRALRIDHAFTGEFVVFRKISSSHHTMVSMRLRDCPKADIAVST